MAKDILQQKMVTFRLLESRLQNLSNQREAIFGRLSEINSTIASINEIQKTGGEALFPIGSSAFVLGKITDTKKLIVEIGAGVALEKDFEEGKKTLEKNKTELENLTKEIDKEMTQTSGMMELLAPEIESLAEKEKRI